MDLVFRVMSFIRSGTNLMCLSLTHFCSAALQSSHKHTSHHVEYSWRGKKLEEGWYVCVRACMFVHVTVIIINRVSNLCKLSACKLYHKMKRLRVSPALWHVQLRPLHRPSPHFRLSVFIFHTGHLMSLFLMLFSSTLFIVQCQPKSAALWWASSWCSSRVDETNA